MKELWTCAFIVIIGCVQTETNTIKSSQIDSIRDHPIQKYADEELSYMHYSFKIDPDTLNLSSLNATLYHARTPNIFDDTEYVLIKDRETNSIFKIIIPSWPTIGMYQSNAMQLQILNSKEEIEPIQYEYLGLEAFINQCESLKQIELRVDVLDSILRFCNGEMKRITSQEELIIAMNSASRYGSDNAKEWASNIQGKLIEKLASGYVVMYQLAGIIFYFEINPGQNFYYWAESGSNITRESYERYYKTTVKGNYYNLRVLRIRYVE